MQKTLISLFLIIGLSAYSQTLVRQESNYQLRKVVYSGNPSQFPQFTNQGAYYAVIPIPEINLTNMPIVNVSVIPNANVLQPPLGLMPLPTDNYNGASVWLTNGICYLDWNGFAQGASGFFTNFVITVIYEDVPTNSPPGQLLPIGQIQVTLTNNVDSGASINLHFTTQTNNFYYIQDSTNLISWEMLDGPFLGSGDLFLKAYPVTNQGQMFYRFSQTSLKTW